MSASPVIFFVEDHVVIGGMVGVHQFVRVGRLAMLGGYSKVVQDVAAVHAGGRASGGYSRPQCSGPAARGRQTGDARLAEAAYKFIYRNQMNMTQALAAIEEEIEPTPELNELTEFIRRMGGGSAGRQDDRPRR